MTSLHIKAVTGHTKKKKTWKEIWWAADRMVGHGLCVVSYLYKISKITVSCNFHETCM
jgi:hypothetical protein